MSAAKRLRWVTASRRDSIPSTKVRVPTYLTNPDGDQVTLSDTAWAQMVRQRRRELLRSITEAALARLHGTGRVHGALRGARRSGGNEFRGDVAAGRDSDVRSTGRRDRLKSRAVVG